MPTVPRADLPKGLPAGRPVVPLVLRGERAGGVAVFGSLRVRGDAHDRISLRLGAGDAPELSFGSGAAPPDVRLYRSGADELKTDDFFVTASGLTVYAGNHTLRRYAIATDAQPTFAIENTNGELRWGLGGASVFDVNLYRSAVDLLKTDDEFEVANAGGKDTLRLSSTAADTGLTVGGDTNLYRSSANNWRTDDDFQVFNGLAGFVILTGDGTVGLNEHSSAPPGIANWARLFADDNGAGKTRLRVIFGSGAAITLATEP